MLLNIAVLGFMFLIVCLASLGCFAAAYNSEGSFWQLFFGSFLLASLIGLSICFITAIVLMILGG